MLYTSLVFSAGLLHVGALSVPPRQYHQRQLPAAAPTLPLLSDFKKDNVTASWAPGHPKTWGEAEKAFSIPDPPPALSVEGVVTADGKFVLLSNLTDVDVIGVETGELVSTFKTKHPGNELHTSVSTAPDGTYDFFVSADNWTTGEEIISQQQISQNGAAVGSWVDRPGHFVSGQYFDRLVLDSNGNRVLLAIEGFEIHLYNLDAADAAPITLTGHMDSPISIHMSPDKKRIATTGFDGYVKVWDATTGELEFDVPPEDPNNAPYNQNWAVRFSPDGKYLLYTIGSPFPAVKLIHLDDPTNITTIDGYDWVFWVRTVEWNADASLLALGGYGWIRILRTSDLSLVQEWEVDIEKFGSQDETTYLRWFDNDTKLRWSYLNGTEMYDFENNLKYRWGPGEDDPPPPDNWVLTAGNWFPVQEKGWFGNSDSDSKIRVWELPE